MSSGKLYSATDRSLYEALNQRNVTNADLRELFKSRGIIISSETPRKQLAAHFSRLTHDFDDYQTLAKLFGTRPHRDRMSSFRVSVPVQLDDYEAAAHELQISLQAEGKETRVVRTNGKAVELHVHYRSTHFNKSEFRQVVDRHVKITIEREGKGVIIHSPYTEDAIEWSAQLTSLVSAKKEVDLPQDEIVLPFTMDAETKNNFFRRLVNSVAEFKLLDVTDAYISRPVAERENDSAEDDQVEDDSQVGGRIQKASFKGEGVLQSEELRAASAKGFFISKVVWTAVRAGFDSDIHEFEAQFSEPDTCSGFSYLPRGFYRYQAVNQYNTTRTGFSDDEDHRLGKLIEAAARTVLSTLIKNDHEPD